MLCEEGGIFTSVSAFVVTDLATDSDSEAEGTVSLADVSSSLLTLA